MITAPLLVAADRAGLRPAFLAFALREFAAAEGLDDAALAARLGCPPEALPHVRLCAAPPADPDGFRTAVGRVAATFGVDVAALAAAVRHGQARAALRQSAADPAEAGHLLAARDRLP